MTAPSSEKFEFKTEIRKLLDIITNSLYTNREIFLRELISNASDALDKQRYLVSKGEPGADADLEPAIDIVADAEARTVTITDTGIGMTREELVENIGTIAHSGSEQFLEKLASASEGDNGSGIIGRFGVGFYSVFMVADRVVIRTLSREEGAAPVEWESDGLGTFEIRPFEGECRRGTAIEIHLKEDAKEFADADMLRDIIKRHSGFVSFPVKVDGELVNTMPALWREPKFQVKPEQYEEFYKFHTYDSESPLDTIHISVDAPVQFHALAFIPPRGNDLSSFNRDHYGLDLYVRRVLIQRENKDLLPEYLGFLKGVVDTEDLPLNISRETLQENVLIRKIGQTLVKQVLTHLERMAREKPETYETFWKEHGKLFRFGYGDFANRDKFAPLLRFNSSEHEDAEGLTSLEDYIARAKEGQKAIYYASGASREAVKLNPQLEIFRRKGVEVLYFYEPVDEFVADTLRTFNDFTFTAVEMADLAALEEYPDVEDAAPKAEALTEDDEKTLENLIGRMKEILGDRVKDIRLSKRLDQSPACLVSPEGGMTSSMQKLMQVMTKDTSMPEKVMELNADHPLVRNLLAIYTKEEQDDYIATVVEQLYESAMLLEGYLSDPHAMVARINGLLEKSSGWYREIRGA